jgi:FecR protein
MARSKVAFALLILGSVLACSTSAPAQAPIPPTPPSAPVPPSPPLAIQPAAAATAQGSQQAAVNPVGSVATLQGSATVTRNNAASALAPRANIFKGDLLQTGADGTLGITFDDDTTFTLKPDSRIAVDNFVYQEGGAHNAAVFNVLHGTVAFLAAQVAHTGDMKIDTPTSTLGIRGTTGLVEIPAGAAPGTTGEVTIKLYPDADGRVGRIEVFGRDGSQLGVLDRGATGFAIRLGALGAARFAAVPLQISPQEAERDRAFVHLTVSTQLVGHRFNIQRRNFQRNQLLRQNLPGRQLPQFQQRGGLLPGTIKPKVRLPAVRTTVPLR